MLCTRITLTTSRRPSAPPSEGESILASRHTCIHGIAESADAGPRDERAAKEEGKGKRRRGKEATLCFPPRQPGRASCSAFARSPAGEVAAIPPGRNRDVEDEMRMERSLSARRPFSSKKTRRRARENPRGLSLPRRESGWPRRPLRSGRKASSRRISASPPPPRRCERNGKCGGGRLRPMGGCERRPRNMHAHDRRHACLWVAEESGTCHPARQPRCSDAWVSGGECAQEIETETMRLFGREHRSAAACFPRFCSPACPQ